MSPLLRVASFLIIFEKKLEDFMTTLPPPGVNKAPENSLESKVYAIVEKYSNYIPIMNDRYRLGYTLFKYMIGEGDPPDISVKGAKLSLEGISAKDLAQKINADLEELKKAEN